MAFGLLTHILEFIHGHSFLLEFRDDLVREPILELLEGMLKGPLLVLYTLTESEQTTGH